ncbi:IS630 family transposase [Clostridium sp. WILCCON 0269]|uniref:IS630 family transposase n=1 Tax=Candidatus Clostridium eludens TaxID=3381663 RepID=A0ABW8SG38_9CLOT
MAEKLKVNCKHASYDMLKQLYQTEKDVRMKTRLLVILYFFEGYSSLKIAKLVHQSDSTVRRYLHRYNKFGLSGLKDIPHPPKNTILSDEELKEIDKDLSQSPRDNGLEYSNWTGNLLVAMVKNQFNKIISLGTAYNILHKLNYSKTRPKKMDKRVDKETLENFRDKLDDLLELKDENTEILYEDEAIITSEPTITRIWSKVGDQTVVKTNSSGTRQRTVVFGAVNPEKGKLTQQLNDKGNTENFKSFLK